LHITSGRRWGEAPHFTLAQARPERAIDRVGFAPEDLTVFSHYLGPFLGRRRPPPELNLLQRSSLQYASRLWQAADSVSKAK
jgi:hypothetical protein